MHMAFNDNILHRCTFVKVQRILLYQHQKKIKLQCFTLKYLVRFFFQNLSFVDVYIWNMLCIKTPWYHPLFSNLVWFVIGPFHCIEHFSIYRMCQRQFFNFWKISKLWSFILKMVVHRHFNPLTMGVSHMIHAAK